MLLQPRVSLVLPPEVGDAPACSKYPKSQFHVGLFTSFHLFRRDEVKQRHKIRSAKYHFAEATREKLQPTSPLEEPRYTRPDDSRSQKSQRLPPGSWPPAIMGRRGSP